MALFPKGCQPPVDLDNRIRLSHFRYGQRLAAIPDVTLADYDARTQGYVTAVKNQKQCGCCYIFAAVGCAESAAIIAGAGTKDTYNLSEQCPLDCADVGGCNGGWPEEVLTYIQADGIATAQDYGPYHGGVGRCKRVTRATPVVAHGYVGSSDAVPTVQALKNALYEHGPLAVAVAADDAFSNYSGGVFRDSGSRDIDHAVILVGWHDDPTMPEGGYWVMRNHWDPSWGEAGYMRIAYGANRIGYGAQWATAGDRKPSGIDWATEI